MQNVLSRRAVVSAGTAVAGAGLLGVAGVGASSGARAEDSARLGRSRHRRHHRNALDLATPAGNVLAYLKMRASIETQDVFFWFGGRIDLAVAGEPIRPIIDVESLILRRTERVGEMAWNVIDWEAALYRDPETGRYLEPDAEIVNPHTGERVKPLHYREGPVRFRFTEMEPRIIGSRDVMPNTGKPFSYPWRALGDDLWMVKSSYITAPNWLKPAEWPRESSGEKIVVGTHSSLRASLSQVQDPAFASVPVDFAYSATSGWLPWMLMGATPGHAIWSEAGRKLFRLEDAPAGQLEMLRRVHPQWFARPEPWPEFTNMYMQYREQRSPAPAPGTAPPARGGGRIAVG